MLGSSRNREMSRFYRYQFTMRFSTTIPRQVLRPRSGQLTQNGSYRPHPVYLLKSRATFIVDTLLRARMNVFILIELTKHSAPLNYSYLFVFFLFLFVIFLFLLLCWKVFFENFTGNKSERLCSYKPMDWKIHKNEYSMEILFCNSTSSFIVTFLSMTLKKRLEIELKQ